MKTIEAKRQKRMIAICYFYILIKFSIKNIYATFQFLSISVGVSDRYIIEAITTRPKQTAEKN